MRLIDADKLIAKIEEIYDGYMLSEDGSVVPRDFVEFLEEAPTVEAIPKSDYEARLKADMVAMLEEIKKEVFVELAHADADGIMVVDMDDFNNLIQQKINKLKGEEE